jgi:porin
MNAMRFGFGLTAAALACAVLGVCAPASAQPPAPMPPPTGPFAGITSMGQSLAQQGIFLGPLSYIEDLSALVSGGQKNGVMPIGHATVGAVFDLQTMFNIPGASIHVVIDERSGISISGIAGTSTIPQTQAGPTKPRLSDLFWEQGFDNDRLDIAVGWLQPTAQFDFHDLSCTFVSASICSQPGSWYLMNNDQSFGTGEWGGRVNFQITPQVYIRGGVYQDNPIAGGFAENGFQNLGGPSVGVFIPVELGYVTGLADTQYPSTFDIGGYQDTSSSSAKPGNWFGPPGQGRHAVYAHVEQTVWRPNRATDQSLTLFAGGIVYSGNGPFWGQYYVGCFDRAPFGSARPADTVSLIATEYQQNVHDLVNAQSSQYLIELNYGASVVPGVTLRPYLQFIANPDNPIGVMNSSGSKHLANDWIIGAQFELDLAGLFNLPVWTARYR